MKPADEQLRALMIDVFQMHDDDYLDENGPDQIPPWDSLGLVSLAVGINEVFGHHLTPQEVGQIKTISDVKRLLREKGVDL